MNVLITNNHVLGKEDIVPGKIIPLSLNNGEIPKNIKIDSERKVYTDKNFDLTIIELNKNDKIEHFLTLDKTIIERINSEKDDLSITSRNYYNKFYEGASVYILNYVEEMFVSYGLINTITEIKINHKCSTIEGASGSPILLLGTNKVIGVHNKGSAHKFQFKFGIFLLKPLITFLKIYNLPKTMVYGEINENQQNAYKYVNSVKTCL